MVPTPPTIDLVDLGVAFPISHGPPSHMDKAAEAETTSDSAKADVGADTLNLLDLIEDMGETERTVDLDQASNAVELMYRPAEPVFGALAADMVDLGRSEEHTSELQSLMRISYAVFSLTKKKNT